MINLFQTNSEKNQRNNLKKFTKSHIKINYLR